MTEVADPAASSSADTSGLMTIDELSAATGLTVRNTRYYASLGLIPAPIRRGRVAFYGPEHRSRLELVQSLQAHGFTLQAIERYVARLPSDITPEDLAMQRAMITSWTDADPDQVQINIGRELRKLGLEWDALAAAREATERHMQELAGELRQILITEVVDPFRRTHHTAEEVERLEQGLPRLRELALESIVVAFQDAMNRVIGSTLLGGDAASDRNVIATD